MKALPPLSVSLFVMMACSPTAQGGDSAPQAAHFNARAVHQNDPKEVKMSIWKASGCEIPESTDAYAGQSQADVERTNGPARLVEEFRLADGVNEFRIELLNLYPLPANGDLLIRELEWMDGDCRLTVWFIQDGDEWIARHGLIWPVNAEF